MGILQTPIVFFVRPARDLHLMVTNVSPSLTGTWNESSNLGEFEFGTVFVACFDPATESVT